MEKLGLSWQTLRKVNEKIIMARISGYGYSKDSIPRQAFDATIQAETGLWKLVVRKKSRP